MSHWMVCWRWLKSSEIVYEAKKKDFDVTDFRLLIEQIKIMGEDFYEWQIWLETVTPTPKEPPLASLPSLVGREKGIASQQRMALEALIWEQSLRGNLEWLQRATKDEQKDWVNGRGWESQGLVSSVEVGKRRKEDF